MNWIKKIVERLFFRNQIKMLEIPNKLDNDRNEFIMDLKEKSDIEKDDGNGYKIITNLRLEDMV